MSNESKLVKLNFAPGINRESTEYAEEGKWYDTDRVRFREGRPENLRGYAKKNPSDFNGTARDLICWTNNETYKLASWGTEKKLYAYNNDDIHDITPIKVSGNVSIVVTIDGTNNGFYTVAGETTVVVSASSHGAARGDFIYFTSSTPSIGGNLNFSKKTFAIEAVIDSNKFSFVSDVAAAATSAGTGQATLKYLLPTGTNTAIQNLGYGASFFNAVTMTSITFNESFGVVGGSSVVSVSSAAHGLDTGNFVFFNSVATLGSNLQLFTDAATSVNSNAGGPTFQVTKIDANRFTIHSTTIANATSVSAGGATANGFFLPVTVTTTAGFRSWNLAANSSDIVTRNTQWSFDNFGEDLIACRRSGRIYLWDQDITSDPARAALVTASPSENNFILVSPNDRHLISFGSNEFSSSIFNPLLVRWSDQNNINNFTPSVSSTSGENIISDGVEIRGAVRSRNAINIWTDNSLWLMSFVGPPFIFRFQQMGTNCGLISPHGAVDFDGRTIWMGIDNFYTFDGQVKNLDCTVREFIFNDPEKGINNSQTDKIYAGINSEFREVIWLYPSANSDDCDRYVIYNPIENTWAYGSGFFTTYADKDIFGNTITTGNQTIQTQIETSTGFLFDNEPVSVYTGDGAALSSFIESAAFDIEDGTDMMFMDRLIPDFALTENKNIEFTVIAQEFPNNSEKISGPFSINSTTKKVDLRARGRQARIKVSSAEAGTKWQYGSLRLSLQPDGRR